MISKRRSRAEASSQRMRELLFGEAVADAAMDAGAEGKVLARLDAVDDQFIGSFDLVLVAVAGDAPHHHLVALLDPGDR